MPAGTTPADIAGSISAGLARAALAAFVDDRMVDLSYPLTADARVRIVTPTSPEALSLYRHSTAHLLAAAVTNLSPARSAASGRQPRKASSTTLWWSVRSCRKTSMPSKKDEGAGLAGICPTSARWFRGTKHGLFRGHEPLKVQLIEEKTEGQSQVSCYTIKDRETFVDFCVGPHALDGKAQGVQAVEHVERVLEGDARNQPMQRVYGTFFSGGELKAHLQRIEEAKKRDHRKLGKSSACSRSISGRPAQRSGSTKGRRCYSARELRDVLFPAGYVEVKTPLVFNKALWERSGHWSHYRQNMFLIESEARRWAEPMNCPGHFLTYVKRRSYRDLPIRYHEQTPLHRNEASGVLSGLTRVRQFSQDDAHCFVTQEQIGDEVERLIRLVQRVYGDFGLDFTAKLSTRPEEFLGEIATWEHAEAQLKALKRAAMQYAECGRRRVLRTQD